MRGRGRPPTVTGARRYPNRLRELRDARGLPQQAVAAMAGISGAYYGALERGDKRINADTAERLSQSLRCAPGDLLGGAQGLSLPVGAKVLVRFFLEPATDGGPRPTHEILYGILDRNIVGDLVLITRTRNRLIPRSALIQSAAPSRAGFAERAIALLPREAEI